MQCVPSERNQQHKARFIAGQLGEAALAIRNTDCNVASIGGSAQNDITGGVLRHLVALIQRGIRPWGDIRRSWNRRQALPGRPQW